MLKVQQSYV